MMMPAFYTTERLVLGMHKTAPIIRLDAEQDQEIIDQDLEPQDKQSVQRGDHGGAAPRPCKGVKNAVRYIALRITIIVLMVIVAVAAQNKAA
ncbi:Amino Acid/Auxin Permease (AAAP) Family [Phytophthora cinnamomi]|uniref:Amino Acid/Auxin Permease (AAAP) Family n=1 Tax=Phytophthora cinnamomi TaxID=4785 RepID=UPI00355AA904|nr:Amino Acid/Auxin Permease (AAAP) Family [Phytophthora cinnamomi]